MDGAFTEIGVGGILAILVLREVFGFLKKSNGKSNSSGEKSVEFWQNEHRRVMYEAMEPLLETHRDILRTNQAIKEGIVELVAMSRNRRKGD